MAKVRLDVLMVEKGMVTSREKARALILAGEVLVNGVRIDKPGTLVEEDGQILLQRKGPVYVSRGGLKLEKAIKVFGIDFKDKVVLDVGASTGGYTDCALQHGARKVYAVDVGYGQLDWSLRNDPRVINMEKTNVRYLTLDDLGELVDIVTIDVSFISTLLVFPVVKNLIQPEGLIVSLIKPQFEAGREKVGKKGVVRDPRVHEEVLYRCIKGALDEGLNCTGITYSPITGPQGNIEYFIKLSRKEAVLPDMAKEIKSVVAAAHSELGGH
ncbi:23S rRNA (cytidine1920-2'-O)/16S rRNA (cytidine1409-2'-O)-methyltransferase [Thermosyntropha lipolytica DSM 11003]|uniref:23S rRNA (Cytidine1920-2'-O)/16S rRNA (Cytidine1409-2'-O)-methyltransferase n=1 Tax=Thermosyntropha lipolytica DSM 11003 TaxID=1123382 RepID=A0A1M5LIF6_9FIRM|nr:TlyA family RNA methyltransferase [Thermosyntropha lipolytica]SHG64746.1 23S rRNA (cytidine1920-2'-O)/16S rRNA (cytidine1409-2'-O)-methyltransferase [Thermosyntropha lipolytica DSM 11003]